MNFQNFMNTEFAKTAMAQYANELFLFYKNINKIEELNFNTTTKVYRDCNDKLKTAIDSDRKNATYTFLLKKLADIPVMENIEILAIPVVKQPKIMDLEVCDFHMPKLEKCFENVNYFLYNNQPKISTYEVIKPKIYRFVKKQKKFEVLNYTVENIKRQKIMKAEKPLVNFIVEKKVILHNKFIAELIKAETNFDDKNIFDKNVVSEKIPAFVYLRYANAFYMDYINDILKLLKPYKEFETKNIKHKTYYKAYNQMKKEFDIEFENNKYYKSISSKWFADIELYFIFTKKEKVVEEKMIEQIIPVKIENIICDTYTEDEKYKFKIYYLEDSFEDIKYKNEFSLKYGYDMFSFIDAEPLKDYDFRHKYKTDSILYQDYLVIKNYLESNYKTNNYYNIIKNKWYSNLEDYFFEIEEAKPQIIINNYIPPKKEIEEDNDSDNSYEVCF